MQSILKRIPAATVFLALAGLQVASAGDVVIEVANVQSAAGEIGCALFATADGFPLSTGKARQEWLPARAGSVTCRFKAIAAGTYAVAVSHDRNGNRRTDTKMFGIPTEDWGVSNNVRPRMRAPKFQEAAFPVAEGQTVAIRVELAR